MAERIPPTREEHPLPAIIMHAVHLTSLIVLVFTGFYIHSPFFSGFMGYARTLHNFAWMIFVAITVTRIYWSFFGRGSAPPGARTKRRDFHWFSPLRHEGEGTFRDTIKYYLFIKKTYPSVYKFNPLQKSTYLFWAFILMPLMLLTGLCIWTPTQSFFEPFTYWLGGLQAMRSYHYLLMWLFIVTPAVHLYLVIAEVARELPLMFAWREGKNAPPKQTD